MKEVYFRVRGRVQGIGFRYWAVKKAQEMGEISGWVHNAADGSVEILATAEEEKIDEFMVILTKIPAIKKCVRGRKNVRYKYNRRYA